MKRPKTKPDFVGKKYLLEKGEVTGHQHTLKALDGATLEVWEKPNRKIVNIKGGSAELTHEEHKKVVLPEGLYEETKKKEYDPFLEKSREVID